MPADQPLKTIFIGRNFQFGHPRTKDFNLMDSGFFPPFLFSPFSLAGVLEVHRFCMYRVGLCMGTTIFYSLCVSRKNVIRCFVPHLTQIKVQEAIEQALALCNNRHYSHWQETADALDEGIFTAAETMVR